MIRIFTNYSYGGYEELFLGTYGDSEEYKYHLPLLPVKEKKLEADPNNAKLRSEVERLLEYPLIKRHGVDQESTLPTGTFEIISQPGYKTIYRRLGKYGLLVIADVKGNDHDEMGGGMRDNPFTMIFVCDEDGDYVILDSLANQLIKKEKETRSFIGGLFSYDPQANGLRFSLKEISDFLTQIQESPSPNFSKKNEIFLLILEGGFNLNNTCESLKTEVCSVGLAYDAHMNIVREEKEVTTPSPEENEKINQIKINGNKDKRKEEDTISQGTKVDVIKQGKVNVTDIKKNDIEESSQLKKLLWTIASIVVIIAIVSYIIKCK